MSQNSTIRKFIDRNVERMLVREFLLSKTERAGFGGLHFQRTPEGTKVTLSAERVGMVIGRKGKIINELQRRLHDDFNIDNPRLEVAEIETPELNAQVMASKLASALERGWYFRRAGHSTLLNIMDKGAKGCLVVLSGNSLAAVIGHRSSKQATSSIVEILPSNSWTLEKRSASRSSARLVAPSPSCALGVNFLTRFESRIDTKWAFLLLLMS